MRKIITILLVVAILAAAGYAIYRWQGQRTATVLNDLQTVKAERGSLTATVGATGTVRSKQTAVLSWKTSGTVETVEAKVAERVKTSDVLASLEQTSLPQNVILAQAELVSAQQALDDLYTSAETARVQSLQAIANYAQAVKSAQYQLDNFTVPREQAGLDVMGGLDLMKEKLDQARAAFEPYKYLSSGNPTREDLKEALDLAQSDYNSAVRRLELEYDLQVAEANLKKARQDYEEWKDGPNQDEIVAAEARVAAAQATLSQAWIEAPFDGTITDAQPQPGDQVTSNLQAFRLDDLSTLFVDVQVSEIDINQIGVGQEVILTFDAILGKEYHGVVTEVAQVGTSTQGVVDFTVTARLTDADEQVKPGMTAAVNIVVSELEDILLVPNRAVRVQDGRRVVYVIREDQVFPVPITLGASSEAMSEVVGGDLQIGDSIVLNPPTEFESNGPPPFVRRGQ